MNKGIHYLEDDKKEVNVWYQQKKEKNINVLVFTIELGPFVSQLDCYPDGLTTS
jgi:hypothetical protein